MPPMLVPSFMLSGIRRAFVGRALPASLVIAACATMPCGAQSIDTTLWVTNGAVDAMVRSGTLLYIGGDFTSVGPASGSGVPINTSTGAAVTPFPKVTGLVFAVVPDGAGGWYVGGSFTQIGGMPRSNIARILASGAVSGWNPGADGDVRALGLYGSTLYAGG